MFCWFFVIFASLSWLYAFHYYVTEVPLLQWGMLCIALVAGVIGFRVESRNFRLGKRYLWLLVPFAVSFFLVPHPYKPPLLLFAVGLVLCVFALRDNAFDFLAQAGWPALLLGAILILQTPVYWIVTAWTARNPEVPFAGQIIYYLLHWIGADTSLSGGAVYIRTMRVVHKFPLTWNHFALFPFLMIWVAGTFMIWWNRSRHGILRRLTIFTAVLIAYSILRLFIVLTGFITFMLYEPYGSKTIHVELFWLPWITMLTILPLVPIVAKLVPFYKAAMFEMPESERSGLRMAKLLTGCALCIGLAVGLRFPDPGSFKKGRVIIDEAHSLWERSDKPYDTDWYGGESGYNFYCIAEYLKHFYDVSANLKDRLTGEKLKSCDVLILKNPTSAFSKEEIDAIEEFVRSGGGLFLVGEHTDVFGTSTFLNPVGERFGIVFRPDAVFDIERKWEQVFFTPRLCVNPILRGVPFFRFAVSCSIDARSWKVRPVIRGTGLWSLPIEYAASNFYPQVEDKTYAKFGAIDQMVSERFGRGRVVGFADSTVYSNFLAFNPGKPEVLLNTIDWLNRSNRLDWICTAGLVVFFVSLVLLFILGLITRCHAGFTFTFVITLSATSWLSLWICSIAVKDFYHDPAPKTEVHRIVFDMEHSSCELPIFGFTQRRSESYEVFYQWVLRCGFYPKVSFDLDNSLKTGNPVVIVNPSKKFLPGTLEGIKDYLQKGGDLLLLDSPKNKKSTANEILNMFDLSFEKQPCAASGIVEPESSASICYLLNGLSVKGGEGLLKTRSGKFVVSSVKVGKGQLVAAGLGNRFVNTSMGFSTRGIPNHEMRAVYELEFTLIRGLVSGDLKKEVSALGKTYSK